MSTDQQDPLATPVNDIDLSYPRITPGVRKMQIASAKVEANKAGTGENLVLSLKTVDDTTSIKGEPVPAGFTITHRISVTQTEKYTIEAIKKNIARVIRGAKLPATTTPRDVLNNPSMLDNVELMINVGLQRETAEFPESNNVKNIVVDE